MPKTETESDAASRRRGRPVGKNRIPLSLAERRARNAQYERERRNETADAMAQLAEAAGYDISMSNGDLLAAVVARLQSAANREPSEDIESLRRCNKNLMQQIAELEERLDWNNTKHDKENLIESRHNTKSRLFKKRNMHSNVKREALDPNEEFKVFEQETLETKLYSNNRDSD